MTTWHFYGKSTGIITGASFMGSEVDLAKQLEHKGAAFGAVMGVADYLAQRVDLATGELVDYRPPAPANTADATYSWDDATRRWVPSPTPAAIANEIRARRDAMLAQCDWTQVGDSPLAPTQKAAWQAYRVALRSIPEQAGFPATVTWPTQPA